MKMISHYGAVAAGVIALTMLGGCKNDAKVDAYTAYVDEQGSISLPEGFREWLHIGSWAVAGDDREKAPIAALHNVYAQPSTIEGYRKTGKFPDGSVLVKEVQNAKVDTMTTGEVGRADDVAVWFVMIKDTKDRFPENKLWGDGWGWAMFNGDDPSKTVTEDYKEACISCHLPAQDNDWVYLEGYPNLTN